VHNAHVAKAADAISVRDVHPFAAELPEPELPKMPITVLKAMYIDR